MKTIDFAVWNRVIRAIDAGFCISDSDRKQARQATSALVAKTIVYLTKNDTVVGDIFYDGQNYITNIYEENLIAN
jgi:hypothetical protein